MDGQRILIPDACTLQNPKWVLTMRFFVVVVVVFFIFCFVLFFKSVIN